MDNNGEVFEIDLIHIITLLFNKIWYIIITALVFGVACFGYSEFFIDPLYQSSALFYVNNKVSIGSTSVSISGSDLSTSKTLVNTYVVILKTRNTLEAVIEKGGYNMSFGALNSRISAASVNETEVFKVTVTDTDPKRACSIANTIAEVFPDKVSEIISGSSAKIVDYAVVEPYKISPNVSKYALTGTFVGAAVACLIIIIKDLLDDTIKTDDFLISTYSDIPVLAGIPNLKKQDGGYYYNYNYYRSKYGKDYSKYYKKGQDENYGQK